MRGGERERVAAPLSSAGGLDPVNLQEDAMPPDEIDGQRAGQGTTTGAAGRRRRRGLRLVVAGLATTFAVEMGIMWFLRALSLHTQFPPRIAWVEASLDAGLLTLFMVPVLWWAFIRPLRSGRAWMKARAELALWGGDLGLWEHDLRTGRVVRNER